MTEGTAIEVIAGFESTYQPAFDVDVAETSGHITRWRQDLDLLRSCGVSRLRYPVRWHRIEREPGVFDWRATDEVLGYLGDTGTGVIVDLLHHTSYPRWLRRGLADRAFPAAYLRYVEAFARRYPDIGEYTLFNEPFTTFLLCGQLGTWPPHLRGLDGFLAVATNVLPAVARASRAYRELLPSARHVYVDSCEDHSAASLAAEVHAAINNDRKFFLLDLFVGAPLDVSRPFVAKVVAAGGEDLLAMEPGVVDVVGLDYYAHNQWHWVDGTGRGRSDSPRPTPLADLIGEYSSRYGRPCMLAETNIRGYAPDRASWLKYTLEQCEQARVAGVEIDGYCWFPFVDSCDWDSVLTRADGHIDPVGVFWLDRSLGRHPSSMSTSYAMAARGMGAGALPAYRFQRPVSDRLRGWAPQMAHWHWRDPPAAEVVPPRR